MEENSSNSSKKKSGNTKQISPSKHWVFTLNNYTLENIQELKNCSSTKRHSFQEETGESGTPHLQGYVEFLTKKRPKSVFQFNAHWEKAKHIDKAIAYTQKLDSRTGKQYLKGIRKIRPLKIFQPKYQWQKDIDAFVDEEPDDRHIHWVWSSKAAMGKTQLCKYLCACKQALLIDGKPGDMKYQVYNAKPGTDIILMNIPKGKNVNKKVYETLELIKDGLFASSKYESDMHISNSPHVFVFANFEPIFPNDDCYDYNSRWIVCKITGEDDHLKLQEAS